MALIYIYLGILILLLIGEFIKTINFSKNNGVFVQSKFSIWLSVLPTLVAFPLQEGLDDRFHLILYITVIGISLLILLAKMANIGYITIHKSTGHRTADVIRKLLQDRQLSFKEEEYLVDFSEISFILPDNQLTINVEWSEGESVFTTVKVHFKKAWKYPDAEVLREDIVNQLRNDLGERSFTKIVWFNIAGAATAITALMAFLFYVN
ncbi:hypothetical protein [Alkalihalobacterium elongatum]|uniref:hypothetical protein n=1 Tax=Alkalihalobacterium elongatum TaxID=2675466 RepID=UPI001C1F356D|nr:hypothetical protein [Alkalihalobacterium elongatum]